MFPNKCQLFLVLYNFIIKVLHSGAVDNSSKYLIQYYAVYLDMLIVLLFYAVYKIKTVIFLL